MSSREYPDRPVCGVGVVCIKPTPGPDPEDDLVLLIKRSKPPYQDHWSLPGGLVDEGETLKAAAERELFEEPRIRAALGAPVDTFDSIHRDAEGRVASHFVLVVFSGPYANQH